MDNKKKTENGKIKGGNIRWTLVLIDLFVLLCISLLLFVIYPVGKEYDTISVAVQLAVFCILCFAVRFAVKIYNQIWRYGGIQSYIKLLLSDTAAFVIYFLIGAILCECFTQITRIPFLRSLALYSIYLLASLGIRMVYRYAFKCGNNETPRGRFLNLLLRIFAGKNVSSDARNDSIKTKVAIYGAGRIGVAFAEELSGNENSQYRPECFIDNASDKAEREIFGLPVVADDDKTVEYLNHLGVKLIIFAISDIEDADRQFLYEKYSKAGFKTRVYDFPKLDSADGKRQIREFDIEDLLFRKPIVIQNDLTREYYKDKTILVTGGGGSIGSEIGRQLAKMHPKKLVILDIYENGAYDLQQELKIAYKNEIDVNIEIVSVTNFVGLERVFVKYKPQIVIMAAAHKHVPLMENNCIEAVENNVFGTLNTVILSEKYNAERVIMVSTDKAVNPTNIMGATKRMCEMIVQAHSASGSRTTFSATRFGNVLGSAGSVIPLFKKQIASGGPVTLTDKRIIRYFMTIPEASQLVLQSGAMAKNGELFVLDMGQPVKILELAENMIKLSGLEPYSDIEIVETGLRPGEKLYEELLVKTEELDKTDNDMIFIERDSPLKLEQIEEKLDILRKAVMENDDSKVMAAMKQVVPTYREAKKN